MATYTTPRTPGQAPSRGGSPRRDTLPGRDTVPGRAPRHTRPIADPGARPARPARPTARPTTRPTTRPARPTQPTQPATRPPARPAISRTRPRHPRAPFLLLLVGLLGGALVCLLVISTTLAQGSYRITDLQQQNANLAKQEQLLTQQVAEAASPTQIAQEAEAFGMRPNPNLNFIDLKTGKVVSGQVSKADAEIDVPGYTP
jgi:hypothetical protein